MFKTKKKILKETIFLLNIGSVKKKNLNNQVKHFNDKENKFKKSKISELEQK